MKEEKYKQEIIDLFLNLNKSIHKDQDRISFFQDLVDKAEKHSLHALSSCFSGHLARLEKDFDQAITNFQKSIQMDKSLAYSWNGLGNVYCDLKDYDKAKECFEKAIQLDETYASPWNGLGSVYFYLEDYDKAKDYYENAIQLDETYTLSWNNLGNLYCDLKDYDKAKDCFEKAIQLDETYAPPWNGLGTMYHELKDYDKAKEFFEKAIQLDPTQPLHQYNLGILMLDQGKLSAASEHLKNAESGFLQDNEEYFLDRTKSILGRIKELQDSEKLAEHPPEPSNPLEMVLIPTMREKIA